MFFFFFSLCIQFQFTIHLEFLILWKTWVSLFKALKPSSHVLVELLPWRGGTEKHDMLPKISSRAFNLLQTDIGGDDSTAAGDGDKDTYLQGGNRPVIFNAICESSFLPALWSLDLDGTFVRTNVGNKLPLCNVTPPLFG